MSDNRQRSIIRITIWGAVANCLLTLAKITAGILGKSAAMVADGVHSLSDLVSDIIVILFVRISSKEQDDGHNYGHGKFETLATLIVSLMLLAVGIKLLVNGVETIIDFFGGVTLPQPKMIALYMAGISIVAKEILYQVTARVGRKTQSQAVIANAWHHRTDAISSIGALLGIAGAIFLGNRWTILDPIAGCIISIVIFIVAVKMAVAAINELMEASLPIEDEKEIRQLITSVQGILNVHSLKTRRNGRSVIIDAHILVDPDITVAVAHDMTEQAEHLLQQRFGTTSQIYLHVEPATSHPSGSSVSPL